VVIVVVVVFHVYVFHDDVQSNQSINLANCPRYLAIVRDGTIRSTVTRTRTVHTDKT
jgi:hypothetical protein